LYFSGIAPDVDAFVVKVFDDERHNFHGFSEGTVYSTDLIAAAQVCKEAGADIINASLGGYNYDQFEDEFFRSLYENDGIITIAAAGNGGDERNVYPAGYDSVFSVSAANEAEQVADFASLNPTSTDILAPGRKKEDLYPCVWLNSFSSLPSALYQV
jgi:serine protease